MTAGVRKLLDLRMSFIPYLYTAFNEYRLTGKPPIRALVLDGMEEAMIVGRPELSTRSNP